jgi:hypothetical protein
MTSRSEVPTGLVAVMCLVVIGCVGFCGEAGAGITYTCDPSIEANQAGTCNFLNSTLAGLYKSTFTNANANIFIQFGVGEFAETEQNTALIPYSTYLSALSAQTGTAAGSVRIAALGSLPTTEPTLYAGGEVSVTPALAQALGIGASIDGITATGGACILGESGCYNAVITLATPDSLLPQGWYFRQLGGAPSSDEYDFYSAVERETDKVLGISSCVNTQVDPLANACGGSSPSAEDLFRYSAAGARSLLSTNQAYFSYDGGNTNVAYFTHTDNGEDFGDFDSSLYNCVHVQDAEPCLGGTLDITNDGGAEIQLLNAIGYNLVNPISSSFTLTLTATGTGAGSLIGAGSYSSGQSVAVSAIPNAGSSFSGWSGSNGTECATGTVVMTANKSCIATFASLLVVPNVVGDTLAAATSAITAAHLVVGSASPQPSMTILAGLVLSQNPSAGSNASSGSPVNLSVSSGSSCADLQLVKAAFGSKRGQPAYNPIADVNNDGIVNISDLSMVARALPAGTVCN